TWRLRAGTLRREKAPRAPGGRYVGLVFLFSMETGELISIFPDGEMQRIRVGATNAIAAKYLAKPDAASVGLLGSGFQALTQLTGMIAVRPIRSVGVYSPNREHREAFATEWSGKLQLQITPSQSARECVDGADIVIAATNSAEPVFEQEWVQPGMFLTSI